MNMIKLPIFPVRSYYFLAFCILIILVSCRTTNNNKEPLPNIVIIFIDDMGYSDIGCFNDTILYTPSIDRLAKEGTKFTSFYVSQSVCSASRSSLITGCYSNRVGIFGALTPWSKSGINDNEITLAELVKQKDYSTAMIGKWHLGHQEKFLPRNHGFDYYFGLPYSNDMWPMHPEKMHFPPLPLIENEDTVAILQEQSMLTKWYTEKAVDFIDRSADKPFFLYLAHTMVHVPLYVSEEFSDTTKKGLYADVVKEIDWSVEKVTEALKRNEIEDNTLIIFASDNGPWLSYGTHSGIALPLREGKGTAWEGGQRVPCIIKWAGEVPEGKISDEPLMTIDILPTLAEITGTQLPDHKIDGESILQLIKDPENESSPHEALFFYYGRKLHAVRSGDWKLHLPHQYITLSGRRGGKDGIPVKYDYVTTDTALYNLKDDISEMNNLKDQYPDKVRELTEYAKKIIAELGNDGDPGEMARRPAYIDGFKYWNDTVDHKAIGRMISYKNPYSKKYRGGGNNALINGIKGSSNYYDGVWQAFKGDDMNVTIDLGEIQQINEVRIGFYDAVPSWIFLPVEVILKVSYNGDNYQLLSSANDITGGDNSSIVNLEIKGLQSSARYIQIIAKNIGICPPGHPGEGKKAWLFIDEIEIK